MPDADHPERRGALNVLYWVEPCPIRNTFTEHVQPTRLLGPVLHRLAGLDKIRLRMFCNGPTAEQCRAERAVYAPHLVEPTAEEAEEISGHFRRWNDETIAQWLELVRGEGAVTAFYRSILERLHAEDPIDVILLWSENGAVRSFAAERGIGLLHGELGPTRSPFPATFYFDTDGTNGNAALRAQAKRALEADEAGPPPVAAQSWLAWCERKNQNETRSPTLLDIPLTYQPAASGLLPDRPYVYVPLQLADDLNTLMHSEFGTPLAFLDDTLRRVTALGYGAVIKGHPGASGRHYNLRHEVEALEHVRQHWPEAVILPRNAPAAISTHALAGADYTVTINSSVGFESLMLGVPTIVRGQAIYDGGGWLQERITLEPAEARRDHSHEIDKLVATHLERMFVPQDVAQQTDYLWHRLRDAAQGESAISQAFDFRPWYLTGGSADELGPITQLEPADPVLQAGAATAFQAGEQVRIKGDAVIFSHDPETRLPQLGDHFFGSLDRVETHDQGQILRGWCLDRRTMAPPRAILSLAGDRVHMPAHEIESRPDVGAAHPEAREAGQAGFRIALPARGHARLLILGADGTCGVLSQLAAPAPLTCHPVRTLTSGGTPMPAGSAAPPRGNRLFKLLGRT